MEHSARHPRALPRALSARDRPVARPHARLLGEARPSRERAAAGDPCRRHQRQGLDRRLPARHAGGGRQARPRLHLAAPGPLPRAHPPRRGRRPLRRRGRAGRGAARRSSGPTPARRSRIRDHHRRRLPAFRRDAGRPHPARGRPRRPLRRHQRGRRAAGRRDHARSRWTTRSSSATRSPSIAGEKAGIIKRGRPVVVGAAAAGGVAT